MSTQALSPTDFRPLRTTGTSAELSSDSSPAELTALISALLQTCNELQQRVAELELTERLRARRSPSHSLGIDY